MAHKVIMPKQGLQMIEGTITKWLKQEGDRVTADEPLFEIETDKLTITIPAPESGTLLKIIEQEGATVPITEVIAVLGEKDEDISMLEQKAGVPTISEQKEKRKLSTPRARWRAKEAHVDVMDISATGPEGLVIEKDVLAYAENYYAQAAETVPKATPLAKTIAKQQGIDITQVSGIGSRGKIVKQDVLSGQQTSLVPEKEEEKDDVVIPFQGMRKVIARRMRESLDYHAQLTHTIKVDMSNAVMLRNTYKKTGIKISYNDIIMRATIQALTKYPMMNSISTEDAIIQKAQVNLGMAVALGDGLIVPNIKNANNLSLEQISTVAKDLAEKARSGRLLPDETKSGTFTVTNLGVYGLDCFTAIINQPESGILAVGAIEMILTDEDEGKFKSKPVMKLTLTYDHRVIDGAPAAQFLVSIKKYIEHPYLML